MEGPTSGRPFLRTRALKRKGRRVHAIDRSEAVLRPLAADVDAVYAGDAPDRALFGCAGLLDARSVVLTTNDEAMNIYLSV